MKDNANLNLPYFELHIIQEKNRKYVFDKFRRKYVKLTPEEWVRQQFLHYLVCKKSVPKGLIAIESAVSINQLANRFDALIYDKTGSPLALLEFKSPSVTINQQAFDQVVHYNKEFNVPYIMVSNGLTHYCCALEKKDKQYRFLHSIPDYREMIR
jgi:type I site-specific restriction endonuclease